MKDEVKKEILLFLDEDLQSVRWQREGMYVSYSFGPVGQRVKVCERFLVGRISQLEGKKKLILLDTRYFFDREEGDILGEEQWKWLAEQLNGSDAQVHLITSGTQILPHEKLYIEKWANYKCISSLPQSFQ
jgi:alkaline phosphatase D